MTVPKEVREAIGNNQLRRSTGTTDRQEAERRRFDLEAEMRQEVLRKVQASTLSDQSSAYQQAVEQLGMGETVYAGDWERFGETDYFEPRPRAMINPPRDSQEAAKALDELERVELEARAAKLSQGMTEESLRYMRRFNGQQPPTCEEVTRIVTAARCGSPDPSVSEVC